ncbi:sugar ABC transporter substrate-binding protein [Thalassobaculum sp.]|uniref:sugar ABC transporter substrate-binding protein n=1 Tax=Thalassobaculum sp. TaxID=2022740 RepID=UPI0032EC1907
MITKNRTNPAYGGALLGASRSAARYGATVRHCAPSVPDDIAEQAALVEQAVAEGPSAIVLLPAHETGLNGAIARAEQAGIPLVLIVSKPTAGRWVSFVGADNVALAATLARSLFDHLGGQASIAIMDGHPDSITTPERHAGFLTAAAEYPGVRILESRSGYYQREPARNAALQLLERHPRIDGLLVSNDLMAMGVMDALDETGRSMAVVSVNGTPEAVSAIRAGRLVASASYDTLSFGSLAVEAALRHVRGEAVPSEIVLPAEIIDRSNVEAWDKPYEERTSVEWETIVTRSDLSR